MLSSFAPFFRSLTMSPATAALDQAHRMARRTLEKGGTASSSARSDDKNAEPADFVLPADIDAIGVSIAVRNNLKMAPAVSEADALFPLERRADGRALVPGLLLRRLGHGRADVGRIVLAHVIREVRAKGKRTATQE